MGNAIQSSFRSMKCLPKYKTNIIKTMKNGEFSTSSFSYHTVEDLNLEHFPDAKQILKEEMDLKFKDRFYRNGILNELLDECGLNTSSTSYLGIEKDFILTVDIDILQKLGFLKHKTDITDQLLSYLELFPYEKDKKFKNQRYVTISSIKSSIERQYLAWKFKVDVKVINCIIHNFQNCFLRSKSMRSIKRNVDLINQIPQTKNKSIGDKIYLLNLTPFSVETLLNFKSNILGISWYEGATLFPELMRKPYGYIFLIIKILQSRNFSNSQIRTSLPFLKSNLFSILKRLNYMLNSNELKEFRKDAEFLKLLSIQQTLLSNLVETQHKSYVELLQMVENEATDNSRRVKINTTGYWYQLQKYFKVSDDSFQVLIKHPKLFMVPESQVSDTVKFLKQMKFTDEEINESITIVLYPRRSIKIALQKINEERDNLAALGFTDGCVPEETHLFEKGTKLRRKTLQLCLYYIERSFNFSGAGVFMFDD